MFHAANRNDRLSTRPFLSIVEKKWIVYQLFQAVSQCHSVGICHGDIKTENIMVTSWTWITLTDFASFKPTYLPEDDPTDFNHFFASASSTGQHRCYLAPERFYSSSADAETEATLKGLDPRVASGDPGKAVDPAGRRVGNLHPSMDVFSLGCVIAEVPAAPYQHFLHGLQPRLITLYRPLWSFSGVPWHARP